jgi:hypothetical protein
VARRNFGPVRKAEPTSWGRAGERSPAAIGPFQVVLPSMGSTLFGSIGVNTHTILATYTLSKSHCSQQYPEF